MTFERAIEFPEVSVNIPSLALSSRESLMQVITVDNLRKAYGDVRAVDGVSFEIRPAEIFGMVGPNGAGKTTTIECLEGLRRVDSGRVLVLGLDPQRQGYELRRRIGVQL